MSYAQRKQLSGNPALSIFLTVAVVGSLLYAIVTGLAYDVVKKAAENLKVAALNLRDSAIRAPIEGIIQTRTVETGQYVTAGVVIEGAAMRTA